MTTNPFTEEVNALLIEQQDATKGLLRRKAELDWFRAFDFEKANTDLRSAERVEADAQGRLPQELQAEAYQKDLVRQLDKKASLSIDPRYWFSAERAIAKRQLVQAKNKLTELEAHIAKLQGEISKAAERRLKASRDMQKARKFDPLNAEGTIATLQATLDRVEPRLASLRQRRDELDELIREPLAQLRKYESQRASLQATILKAEEFDAELSRASSGRERGPIHQKCESELGDGQPRNVLRTSRGALRGVDESLGKLRARIDGLVRFATHDIRRIVIDGNNMCYRSGQFIDFLVLEAVVPLLAQKYEVRLIFDASIRRRMGMRNQDIEARFPQARIVHVVANRQKADETILSVAEEDDHTFVVSNDKYVDYPEKMAVKERRVLRHEIVDQVAYIHDLHIAAKFTSAPAEEQTGNARGA